jgi:hypothetical protein
LITYKHIRPTSLIFEKNQKKIKKKSKKKQKKFGIERFYQIFPCLFFCSQCRPYMRVCKKKSKKLEITVLSMPKIVAFTSKV